MTVPSLAPNTNAMAPNAFQEELIRSVSLLDRAVVTKETRVIARVVRGLNVLRRQWHPRVPNHQNASDGEKNSEAKWIALLPEDAEAEAREKQRRREASKTAEPNASGEPEDAALSTTPQAFLKESLSNSEGDRINERLLMASREACDALAGLLNRVRLGERDLPVGALQDDLRTALVGLQTKYGANGLNLAENGTINSKEMMQVEESRASADSRSGAPATLLSCSAAAAEVGVYIHLLVLLFVIDARISDSGQQASSCADRLLIYLQSCPMRHTLDELSARSYQAIMLAYEVAGKSCLCMDLLFKAHRAAVVRHDHVGQAVLSNQILRAYIQDRQYAQADQFVSRSVFPETRSNNQLARYFYYVGRIKAIQLDYTEAYRCLSQAQRKAPQHTAMGFRVTVTKLLALVQLLMGEIPELGVFYGVGMSQENEIRQKLKPYLALAASVRNGHCS